MMKLFLKILLSVVLLGVVVSVSYLKTLPEGDSGSGSIVGSSSKFGATDIASESIPADSTGAEVGAGGSEPANDKIETKKTVEAEEIPTEAPIIMAVSTGSVVAIDSSKEKVVADTVSAASTDSAAATENLSNSDEVIREEQIVRYFKLKLSNLPDDLSSYEKKVAIKEVRDETCDLFHISRVRLNQLAKVHKISYP